jgi:tRNA/rRNA methyltransferase
LTLEDAASACIEHARAGDAVALVFGGERYGLDNQDVMRCQAMTSIPTSRHYTSLNLAQAVQLVAYECQRAAHQGASAAKPPHSDPLASAEDRERLFVHLEEVLVAVDFIKPGEPRRVMQRLRRLFSRTELEAEEVAILRGICTQILTRRKP